MNPEPREKCWGQRWFFLQGGPRDFQARVKECGSELDPTIQWLSLLTNFEALHWKWINSNGSDWMEKHYSKVLCFEASLKQFRQQNTDAIESKTCFALPFLVQIHIANRGNIGWTGHSCLLVYVDLKVQDDEHHIVLDEILFQFC